MSENSGEHAAESRVRALLADHRASRRLARRLEFVELLLDDGQVWSAIETLLWGTIVGGMTRSHMTAKASRPGSREREYDVGVLERSVREMRRRRPQFSDTQIARELARQIGRSLGGRKQRAVLMLMDRHGLRRSRKDSGQIVSGCPTEARRSVA